MYVYCLGSVFFTTTFNHHTPTLPTIPTIAATPSSHRPAFLFAISTTILTKQGKFLSEPITRISAAISSSLLCFAGGGGRDANLGQRDVITLFVARQPFFLFSNDFGENGDEGNKEKWVKLWGKAR